MEDLTRRTEPALCMCHIFTQVLLWIYCSPRHWRHNPLTLDPVTVACLDKSNIIRQVRSNLCILVHNTRHDF